MIDLILTGGTVVSMDRERRVIPGGAVAVHQGRILFVGTAAEAAQKFPVAAKTVDCSHKAILPGLVDAHGHGGHGLLKSIVLNTSYWMPVMCHTYKHYVSDEFWYHEGRYSALERLKAGVTTGVCVLGSQPRCDDPVFALNHARAYGELGVREVVCTGPCTPPWPHEFSRWDGGKRIRKTVTYEELLGSLETVIRQLNHAENDRIRAFVTPMNILPSTDPSNPTPPDRLCMTEFDRRQNREMRRIAREYGTRIHTDAFGGGVWLAAQDGENALLGPDVLLQHCIGLSKDECKILADTGTHVGSSPGGSADVHTMMMLGVNVCVTTDGPKFDGGFDLFQAMRAFQAKHRNMDGDGNYLPAEKLLEMVTVDAARALGWEKEIGSLEEGKKADIITLNLLNTRLMPDFNLVQRLVGNAQGSDVDHVFVDGRQLMEDGVVTGVDERAILLEGHEEAARTVERAGLDKFAFPTQSFWGQYKQYYTEPRFDLEWSRRDGGYY